MFVQDRDYIRTATIANLTDCTYLLVLKADEGRVSRHRVSSCSGIRGDAPNEKKLDVLELLFATYR